MRLLAYDCQAVKPALRQVVCFLISLALPLSLSARPHFLLSSIKLYIPVLTAGKTFRKNRRRNEGDSGGRRAIMSQGPLSAFARSLSLSLILLSALYHSSPSVSPAVDYRRRGLFSSPPLPSLLHCPLYLSSFSLSLSFSAVFSIGDRLNLPLPATSLSIQEHTPLSFPRQTLPYYDGSSSLAGFRPCLRLLRPRAALHGGGAKHERQHERYCAHRCGVVCKRARRKPLLAHSKGA